MNPALCLVRAPGVPLVTLATFLARHAVTDDDGRALALDVIAAGASFTCALTDGRTIILERRGPLIVGTALPADDATREACLDAIGSLMRDRYVPGGTVDLWLAPIPTDALAAIVAQPCTRWPELLLMAAGQSRAQALATEPQDLGAANMTHIVCTLTAEGTLMAWATCLQARAMIAAGQPARALDAIRAFTRLAQNIPPIVCARFSDQLDRLFAEAETLHARQRAHEVA